jgi:endoglucanase
LSVREPGPNQPRDHQYAYNAIRTPWRLALSYKWFGDERAKEYLNNFSVLSEDYSERGKLATAYQHNGEPWEDYESVAAYSGNLGYFIIHQPEQAKSIYEGKILEKFYENANESYWDDPKNYYTQNLAWFATALYADMLPNLWSE